MAIEICNDPLLEIRTAIEKAMAEAELSELVPLAAMDQIIDRTIDFLPDFFRQELRGASDND